MTQYLRAPSKNSYLTTISTELSRYISINLILFGTKHKGYGSINIKSKCKVEQKKMMCALFTVMIQAPACQCGAARFVSAHNLELAIVIV
jgi:hypothetical protein